ncbi:MAG: metallophosphoesterase [Gemmatimonadales bacterium]|nr:metallophosphoesterase [Gemmatimonadales bacterium]
MTRISRRGWLFAAAGVAGAGVLARACGEPARDVRLTRHDVALRGLPAAFDGLRIAQLTDLHLPARANADAGRRALALLAAERPDVVLHTGDMLETLDAADALVALARAARGTLATFATLGNWEWYCGCTPPVARDLWAGAGVQLLDNECGWVERGGERLAIVGIDDPVRGRPDVARATAASGDAPSVVAVHAPGLAASLPARAAPSLVLSGHTHGGQVRLPGLPAFTPSGSGPFVSGWYGVPAGSLYVSRGVGTSSVRARLNCPAELPVFTLRRGG